MQLNKLMTREGIVNDCYYNGNISSYIEFKTIREIKIFSALFASCCNIITTYSTTCVFKI